VSDIDAVALGRWLADNVDGITTPECTIDIISGGASNLTIGVRIGEHDVVVRRPPVGAFLPSANDVSREYRYLSALQDTDVPTPPVHAFCDDESVIGAPFYVMTRLFGAVPHDPSVLAHLSTEEARAAGLRFIDVLKTLHAVDIDAVGLGDAAKRTGYLGRQVSRWTDQWHRAKEGDDPVIDELSNRLSASVPPSGPATIVHGDFRLGNVMYGVDEPTDIIGVFDWEMATLGDPLADVGYTLLWWGTKDRPPMHPSAAVADLPGFPSADEVVELYGADPDIVRFHLVLAAFKLTIIGVGNMARARRLGHDVPGPSGRRSGEPSRNPLAEWALDLVKQGS
jgi:aminoglycoside phosphotransferase (APT) family kinase protein